jgi:hypothetical protein
MQCMSLSLRLLRDYSLWYDIVTSQVYKVSIHAPNRGTVTTLPMASVAAIFITNKTYKPTENSGFHVGQSYLQKSPANRLATQNIVLSLICLTDWQGFSILEH